MNKFVNAVTSLMHPKQSDELVTAQLTINDVTGEKLTPAQKRKATIIERYGSMHEYARMTGLKAAATNKRNYGLSFYKTIGRKGGTVSRGGYFTQNREAAKYWGSIGGKKSRRPKDNQ